NSPKEPSISPARTAKLASAWPRSPNDLRRRRRRSPSSSKRFVKNPAIRQAISPARRFEQSLEVARFCPRSALGFGQRGYAMKLNWKWIGIGVGGLVGVLVLAVVLFIAFFPKELAAREAERRIEEATGRDLVLGNNIEVSFWPAMCFSVDDASLSNPEGFENPARRGGVDSAEAPFIAADRIVFAVKVMPLLRGAIEVKELIFEGAQVNLVAHDDGANNWTFPTEETAENQTTLEDLRLDDVRLVDGMISFQGAEGEAPLVLEDVDASLALESLDAPAQLQAAFNYRGERMSIDGEIGLPRAVLEKGETPITARINAAPLEASFDGAFNSENGALAGALEANGSSLRRLLAWMGSPMGEGGGFANYSLNARMERQG